MASDGAFMFWGIATNVHVPIIYGRAAFDPFESCDMSGPQIHWLRATPKKHQRAAR